MQKKFVFFSLLIALSCWPAVGLSSPAVEQGVTLTVNSMRELWEVDTDFATPVGGIGVHSVFAIQCAGAVNTVVTLTHDNPVFDVGPEEMQIECGTWFWYDAAFYPQAPGIYVDHITFSGEFGTIPQVLIGNAIPVETPEYWIADLGAGSSAMRLVYDDERNNLYISDAGNNQIIVFSPALQSVVKTINIGPYPVGLALTPDSQMLYVANLGEKSVSVVDVDLQTETERITIDTPEYNPYEIAVVSDTLALFGTSPSGFASGEGIFELNLVTKQDGKRSDLPYMGNGRDPVIRTSRDYNAAAIVVEPESSPTQLARYDRITNSFTETNYGLERTIALNNNGSRIVTSNADCSLLTPNLTIFNQEMSLRDRIKLAECQPLSLVFNPVSPDYIYAIDGRESGIVDIASLDLNLQTKRLMFTVPEGYYPSDLAISGDGMWLYSLLVQTWNAPPSKLLAVKVGPPQYSDDAAPQSSIAPLPPTQTRNWWMVSWSGTDDLSGIEQYEVEYRVGLAGDWTPWLDTSATSGLFLNASPGQDYYFRVIAHDKAGNIELFPASYDTFTTAGDDTAGLNQIYLPMLKR